MNCFRRDFGWSPRFPSYREGLEEVIARWRAENFLGLGQKHERSVRKESRELRCEF